MPSTSYPLCDFFFPLSLPLPVPSWVHPPSRNLQTSPRLWAHQYWAMPPQLAGGREWWGQIFTPHSPLSPLLLPPVGAKHLSSVSLPHPQLIHTFLTPLQCPLDLGNKIFRQSPPVNQCLANLTATNHRRGCYNHQWPPLGLCSLEHPLPSKLLWGNPIKILVGGPRIFYQVPSKVDFYQIPCHSNQ